jgi:hypothetical protein
MNTNSNNWETINSSSVPSTSPPIPPKTKLEECTIKLKKARKTSFKKDTKLKKIKEQLNKYKRSYSGNKASYLPNTSSSEWETTDDEYIVSPSDHTITHTHYHQIKDHITRRYLEYDRNPVYFLNTFLESSKTEPSKFVRDIEVYNNIVKQPLKHMFFIIKMTVPTKSRSKIVNNTTFCLMTSDGVYPIDYMNVNNSVDPFSVLQMRKKKQKSAGIKSVLKGLRVAGESICSQEIGAVYITEQYTDYSTIAVISFGLHKKSTRGLKNAVLDILQDVTLVNNYDVLGFVYCEPYKQHPIDSYIPLICSNKNFGSVLLKFIENLASYIGYEKMQLSAIESAVSYYYFKSNYNIKRGGKYTIDYNYELSTFIKRPIKGSKPTMGGRGENINRVIINTVSTKKRTPHPNSYRQSKRIQSLKVTPHKEYTLFNVATDEDDNIKMAKVLDRYE